MPFLANFPITDVYGHKKIDTFALTMPSPVKIAAVSYANTWPFIYGLGKSGFAKNNGVEVLLRPPAECLRLLREGEVQAGLVPVAGIPQVPDGQLITDFCIGANGPVRTVVLLSHTPLADITTIHLDGHSRTSVALLQLLAKEFWRKDFYWLPAAEGFEALSYPPGEAILAIGDKVFACEANYTYRYDLAAEWKNFTGRPFVFAAWVARPSLPDPIASALNDALQSGVADINGVVAHYGNLNLSADALRQYLTLHIQYQLDEAKQQALALFLEKIRS